MLWWTHVTNLILGRLTHTKWTITPLGMQVLHPFEVKFLESVIWRPLVPIVSQKKSPPRQEWCQRILQSYRSKIVAKIIVQFSSYRIHTFCFAPIYPQNGAVYSYSVAAGKNIITHWPSELDQLPDSPHWVTYFRSYYISPSTTL